MEADERTSDLLASAINPPPPPSAPPPARSSSRERRSGVLSVAPLSSPSNRERLAALRTTKSQERSWRRRPDDEVPHMQQSYSSNSRASQRSGRGNAGVETQRHGQGVEVGLQPTASAPNGTFLTHESLAGNRNTSRDIEQSSTTSGGTSWSLRMPWLKQKSEAVRDDVENTQGLGSPLSFGDSDTTYYRDVMNAYDFMNMHEIVGDDPVNDPVGEGQEALSGMSPVEVGSRKLPSKGSDGMMSSCSHLGSSQSSAAESTADSLADFKDSEWTPQDSSYGAACPLCGCVPKKTRRAVEFTMIGLVIISLVYLVVTTSIRITNDHTTHSGGTSDADVDLDDDFYVEWSANGDDGGFDDDDTYAYAEINDDQYAYVEEEDEEEGDDARFLRRQAFRKSSKMQDVWLTPWV